MVLGLIFAFLAYQLIKQETRASKSCTKNTILCYVFITASLVIFLVGSGIEIYKFHLRHSNDYQNIIKERDIARDELNELEEVVAVESSKKARTVKVMQDSVNEIISRNNQFKNHKGNDEKDIEYRNELPKLIDDQTTIISIELAKLEQ